MNVLVINDKKIKTIKLPNEISGIYWITEVDSNGIEKNLISIEAIDNKWNLVSNKEIYNIDNNIINSKVVLEEYHFYEIKNDIDKTKFKIYCTPNKENYISYGLENLIKDGITIGGGEKDKIYCQEFQEEEFCIKEVNNKVLLIENNPNHNIYINDVRVNKGQKLQIGDIIFIEGLKIIYFVEEIEKNKMYPYLLICDSSNFSIKLLPIGAPNSKYVSEVEESDDDFEFPLYDEKDYFYKKPRILRKIESLVIKVDAPPTKQENKATSAILTIGPMLSMSMISIVSLYNSLSNLYSGKATWNEVLPSIIICGAMFSSVFVWPLITKWYNKIQEKKHEKIRQEKYSGYIDSKRELIKNAIKEQSSILYSNNPDVKECESIILEKKSTLWQRRIYDDDFLNVNLGNGLYPMDINISYPEEKFSLYEDNLKEMVQKLANEPKMLFNVPIVFSFIDNYIAGLIGNKDITSEYLKRLLIEIMAFHSYDDLKIIILTDSENEYRWKFLKNSPHLFSDNKDIRFFASNNEEYKEVCYFLEKIFTSRKELSGTKEPNPRDFNKFYLVITDCFKKVRDYDIIKKILESKNNYGFSLFILSRKLVNLPDQCSTFIEMNQEGGELYNSSTYEKRINFNMDMISEINYDDCIKKLANLPIEIDNYDEGNLPNKIGFLEMNDVGRIEQLNSSLRWEKSNPITSLQAPLGIGKNMEKIYIDLHEKFHGPHGLIAGSTGSGKSELIITYMLSMAINYHPYEVQFILIDYKGGGLAGAFEDKEHGIKLPHLVGTITNLDTNEIKRCLSSIESELKRRQALFNKARDLSSESTIDIYKYQKMYREKLVNEPVSHLFIICDEFAELKTQQPEFMEHLISTARIGRSLGVHLILATQKPSGVVDPQIWSNTRFRICMRVQDKSDSNEVIKCPDAAFLKQTGRFYFQVGYNEIFLLGQSAWAGGKYYPEEKVKKTVDTSIDIINNIGYILKKIETKSQNQVIKNDQGEEMSNIVKYLDNLAKNQNVNCKPLWLDRIPDNIKIEELARKYDFKKEIYVLNPIIGEYDDPKKQEQHLLTLPLSKEGNALVYGASGSGKENFITTLVYSSSLYYSPKELNYYIVDFGSLTLKMFNTNPLVGSVLTVEDDEEIKNLYKMLIKIIDERKKLFADYNGDYYTYCKSTNNIIPNIVVIINNYESYQEIYGDLDDTLIMLSRDCNKYGIFFVITVNTPNGIRFKFKQNFSLVYSLQQNNNEDYTTILGNVSKTYPAKIFGRGIFKTDDIYEFQTALATNIENIPLYIKEVNAKLNDKYQDRALPIPVLPEVVEYKNIASEFNKDNKLIIGIDKDSLEIKKFDFKYNFATLISAFDMKVMEKFVNAFINQLLATNKYNVIVINASDILINEKYIKFYEIYNYNFDEVFNKIKDIISIKKSQFISSNYNKNIFNTEKEIYCLILGIDNFKNRLNDENKKQFQDIFIMAKELGIINYLIIDSLDKIKKIEYEGWFKSCVDQTSGIWIGEGINDQFILKPTQKISAMKEKISNEFCFLMNRGKVNYVKYVSSFELNIIEKKE